MPYNSNPRYSYSPHNGMWRVYKNEYIGKTCTGEPIEEYRTREEARKRVYQLNGWNMKKYIGTKQVEAEPMTLGVAFIEGFLQRDRIPSEEEKSQPGYHVKYKGGYESWSPAEPFEEAYMLAETSFDRLMIEQEELADKLQKLRHFIESPNFLNIVEDEYHRLLLSKQESYMSQYLEIINERIKLLR